MGWLADVEEGAGDLAEFRAHFGEDLRARAALLVKLDVKFIHRHGHHVVVAFGAARAAADALYLGDRLQKPHADFADFVALLERCPRRARERDDGATFVERGQEVLAHHRIQNQRPGEQRARDGEHEQRLIEREAEPGAAMEFLERANEKAVVLGITVRAPLA